MKEIELEKTFLVSRLPLEIESAVKTDLLDIYLPRTTEHPFLRIRKRGDKYCITKKVPAKENNFSEFIEETIPLSKEEYNELSLIAGKRLHKIRHTWRIGETTVDLDIFQDDLFGLVIADFEFNSIDAKEIFVAPDWCLCDVTQAEFIAGGLLAGKKYSDIKSELLKFGYKGIN